ncbi:MAG TPA: hypothetical protein PKD64_04705 [Pirellulaceae bacterium]|nr:hypothetical protein [Pirellulaceae bacterium]HMO91474.1 hypothetical protein [Pirellulaceae bacterium]HMP70987.1 hypothetical protein [Pirellulaceae bacterium]
MNYHIFHATRLILGLISSVVLTSTVSVGISQSTGSNNLPEFVQSTTVFEGGLVVSQSSVQGQPAQTVVGYGTTQPMAHLQPQAQQNIIDGNMYSGYRIVQAGMANQRLLFPTSDRATLPPPPIALNPENSTNYQVDVGGGTPQNNLVNPNFANQIPTWGLPGNYVTPPARTDGCCGLLSPNRPGIFGSRSSLGTGQVFGQPQLGGQTMLPLQNQPPGEYQGTGLLGRPKTYVDGQPIRNLLRFFGWP